MKKSIAILALMCCAWLTFLDASTKQGYQQATVVKVEKYEAASTYVGGGATDAPLQPEVYAYDIGLKVNCDVYVGRYESATDYLPSIFARNHEVDVRVQKHILFVSLPDSDRDVKMGILSHRRLKEQSCTAN
jgi:hypothetical protein